MPGGKLGNQYLGQSGMCSSFGRPSGSLQRKVIGEQSLSCLKRASFCVQYTNSSSTVFSPGADFSNVLLVTSEKAHITSQTFWFIVTYIYRFGVTLGIKAFADAFMAKTAELSQMLCFNRWFIEFLIGSTLYFIRDIKTHLYDLSGIY